MPRTAADLAIELYGRWSDGRLERSTDSVAADVQLVCDPLHPEDSLLEGIEGWRRWVSRWDEAYEAMRVTIDGLVAFDDAHVLAFVTIAATPRGTSHEISWGAAHLWTARAGRIVRWEPHVDLAAARGTLA